MFSYFCIKYAETDSVFLKIMRTSIKITTEKLDLQECYQFVEDDSCGGISAFIGTVRNDTQ